MTLQLLRFDLPGNCHVLEPSRSWTDPRVMKPRAYFGCIEGQQHGSMERSFIADLRPDICYVASKVRNKKEGLDIAIVAVVPINKAHGELWKVMGLE